VRRPNATLLTRAAAIKLIQSIQIHLSLLLLRGPALPDLPEVQVVGARAPQRMPCSQQNGRSGRWPPAAKPARALRPRHARSRLESYGSARAASGGPGHAAGRAAGELHAICMRASNGPLHEACAARPRLRAAAGAVHALTHASAVCCVLCVGCSAEAGSHSSRPHSSPTLIVQESQSSYHMANGTLQALIGRNL
jgi:hypothetical protein